MTLLHYAKAPAYFRSSAEVALEDMRQILAFVLHDKLVPDTDAPFFEQAGQKPLRTDRVSWLRRLFDLAGAIVALFTLRVGARVQATLWSGKKQVTLTDGFIRDEDAILRVFTGFYGSATQFPIHVLRDTYAKRPPEARPAPILIISDDGVSTMFDADERGNDGWDMAARSLASARGAGLMVLNIACAIAPAHLPRFRENVRAFAALGRKTLLRANTVLMRGNVADHSALCRELATWGFRELTFNQLGGKDRPEFFPDNRLLPKQAGELFATLPALRSALAARGINLRGSPAHLRRIIASTDDELLRNGRLRTRCSLPLYRRARSRGSVQLHGLGLRRFDFGNPRCRRAARATGTVRHDATCRTIRTVSRLPQHASF